MEGFRACFADLVDPRRGNAQRHELDEIVMLALLAMVSGAETCVDMALFGRSKEALLRRFLRLPGGIPSHDTFSRVFRLLDPVAFEACFARYVAALAERIQGVIAVDGKTARRSFDRRGGQGPLHLISAFACDTRLALPVPSSVGRDGTGRDGIGRDETGRGGGRGCLTSVVTPGGRGAGGDGGRCRQEGSRSGHLAHGVDHSPKWEWVEFPDRFFNQCASCAESCSPMQAQSANAPALEVSSTLLLQPQADARLSKNIGGYPR